MPRRIGLVGCVKRKRSVASRAADLYTSTLFTGRRTYVERTCDEWWVLSAEHGLVAPTDVLEPYDVTLNDASRPDRRRWATKVLGQIDERIRLDRGDVIECHAGANYLDFGLADGLRRRGCILENPTEGLGIGRQLQFYKAHA